MKRILRIVLVFAVLVGIIAGVGLAWLAGPSDPSFEGKKLSAWLTDTANKRADVRDAAKAALKRMDAKALPPLLERLNFVDDPEKQKWAATFNLNYEPALGMHLAAVRGIAALGPQAKSLIPDLSKLLENESTRDDAASALAGIGPDAIDPMIALLSSSNPQVRAGAAKVLGRNGSKASTAVPTLLKLAKDENDDVRFFAIDSLGLIKSDAPHVVPALIAALDDKTLMNVATAANALGQFGDLAKDALPRLKSLARNKDLAVNSAAKSALSQINGGAEGAAPATEKSK